MLVRGTELGHAPCSQYRLKNLQSHLISLIFKICIVFLPENFDSSCRWVVPCLTTRKVGKVAVSVTPAGEITSRGLKRLFVVGFCLPSVSILLRMNS